MAFWNHADAAQEDRKRDIELALAQWKEAERYFQSVQETDLMDFAIYEMEAARRKYVLLLRRYSQEAAAAELNRPGHHGREQEGNRMETLLLLAAFGVGLLLLWLVCKLLAVPLRILWRLLLNAVVGALLLLLVNFFGGLFGLALPITPFSSLVAGVFGVPGVIVLFLLQYLL